MALYKANAANALKTSSNLRVHILFMCCLEVKGFPNITVVYHQSFGGYTLYNGQYQQAFPKGTRVSRVVVFERVWKSVFLVFKRAYY